MIKTQQNERRCYDMTETHILPISGQCPVTENPLPGSKLSIIYQPGERLLEVESLRDYVDSYKGGREDVRSMEGMVQAITQHCADALGVICTVRAELKITPNQEMVLNCVAWPPQATAL